ncbi:MAG: Hsp70 family protein [Chloroflexi bacterium]|nr:Hsp70 family protein [Chloroflexota bacterium]
MAKLGIDLGTSNSCAAVVFDMDLKNPVTVEPIDGHFMGDLVFPSCVAFNKKGEVSVVGLPAWERLFKHGQSDLVVRHFKRLIGRPFDHVIERISKGDRAFSEFRDRLKRSSDGSILVTVGERDVSVVEIAAHLLKKIVEDSETLVRNRGEKIESVVVTLPAGFEDKQRQETLQAAKLAGLEGINITVIEEPTAAAIARGLGGTEGKIMVIDVGAGTTDVITGYMERTPDGPHLVMTDRGCDDVLGGIDMDNKILEYLFKNDAGLPKLEDIFYELEADHRNRLMGKIEEAKIVASRDGNSGVSIGLSVVGGGSKRINVPLDEKTLSDIVEPIISGYEESTYRKGIRPVVERALLSAAGGNPAIVPKVINEIDWLILVGGPCRVSRLHQVLKDIFKANAKVITQINNIDRADRLIKEAVAQGAALSQVKGIEVTNSVPYTLSIFHESGVTPVIGVGTPYDRAKGTSQAASIPMTPGSNLLWILSQKGQSEREWSMRSHIVNVPQEGKLKVNLKWSEGGSGGDKISVEGCGLPGSIDFPPVHNNTILGKALEDSYRWYITAAKDLRQLLGLAREPLVRRFVAQVGAVSEAERRAGELLEVSELDLKNCDNIDVDAEGHLNDEEISLAAKAGYFEGRRQVALSRGLLSARAAEVLNGIVLPLLASNAPTTPDELINEANKLLNVSRNCSPCTQFWQQLNQWAHRLELTSNDHTVASATATALGALADCSYGQQIISEEELYRMRGVCWRFYGER